MNLAEFCAPGTTYLDRLMPLSCGVSLRVVSFTPSAPAQPWPVVLIPGLVSVMATFQKPLLEFTRDFVVHYIETRDKSSSRVDKKADFAVRTIGLDVVEVISLLGLKDRGYVAFGASLGATILIDCYEHFRSIPLCLVLLEPNAVFDYPPWSLAVIRYAAPFYRYVRPVAKWYLKNFRVNTRDDYEMYRINCRALDAADPCKLRDTILAISSYRIWDRLEPVRTPSLIVGASKDTFHRHGDIMRIVSLLRTSTYIDLEKHERTHSGEIVEHVRGYLRAQGLGGSPLDGGDEK